MRFSFVILHYLAPDVTQECIGRILSLFRDEQVSVVVVDNASPDGSGEQLRRLYADCPSVVLLTASSNLGFARGNNLGYRYAVDNLSPDFVVVMNNDVMLDDEGFLRKIEAEYASEPFSVLGPDIFAPSASVHQNPIRLSGMTLGQARALRMKMALKNRFFAYQYFTWKIKLLLGLASEKTPDSVFHQEGHEDCVLHGACYIFSKDFIKAREHAFNPDTFLYTEEDILHYECMKAGLTMRYTPHLAVRHLEDVSTNRAFRSGYKRSKMKYARLVQSLDVLIRLMEEDEK